MRLGVSARKACGEERTGFIKYVTSLTYREIHCLHWCKEGKTNWEIGEILVISEKTVEFHLGNVMKKLGAANRMTAVVLGIREGTIPL